jgi:hypothetical protein
MEKADLRQDDPVGRRQQSISASAAQRVRKPMDQQPLELTRGEYTAVPKGSMGGTTDVGHSNDTSVDGIRFLIANRRRFGKRR